MLISTMRKGYVVLASALIVISAMVIPLALLVGGSAVSGSVSLKRFTSYAHLESYIRTNVQSANQWYYRGFLTGPPQLMLGPAMEIKPGLAPEATVGHSTTNVQVAGVDEADLVKTDGDYIYLIRGTQYATGNREMLIIKAYPPQQAEVLYKFIWPKGVAPMELFVNGDKLIVFVSKYDYEVSPEAWGASKAEVCVYNIQDRSMPELVRNITIDGSYVSSRMVGDFVYVVITTPAYIFNDMIPLPTISTSDTVLRIAASDIYYSEAADVSYVFTTVLSFSVKDDVLPFVTKTVLMGATSTIYVSLENIYLAMTKVDVQRFSPGFYEETLLFRIGAVNGNIELVAEGSVPGRVLNQFSLDEYRGYLRVATTTGQVWSAAGMSEQQNHVYVLDASLKIVGRIENIAPGERIYSARFIGDRGYIVTFKKVDPFFVIDVKDPFSPKILGWLKIPGFSDYLHPLDDDHILGIGKDTVGAEEGDFAWYQGMKISIFDVTNVSSPVELSKYEIGDRGTDSPALYDHKALLFDLDRNMLVIPVLVAYVDPELYPGQVPPYAYGRPVWQGAYVLNVTLQEDISLIGRITHQEEPLGNGTLDYSKFVFRSLYIGNFLYTISDSMIKVNTIQGLTTVSVLPLV
jgi:uncharacterized secreted protein with C-terminal beta-propeller domain